MSCSDKEFVEYVKRKQDMFEEGHNMSSDNLMKNAAEKYKTLVQKGRWNSPDVNEQKILALQTELRKLKKNGKGGGKNSGKIGKSDNSNNKKPGWFDKRPNGDITKPREWKGKMWYYCHKDTGGKCDGKHRMHKPSECKGKAYSFKQNGTNMSSSNKSQKRKSDDKNKDKNKRQMRLNQSLRASAAEAENDEKSSSSSQSKESDSE